MPLPPLPNDLESWNRSRIWRDSRILAPREQPLPEIALQLISTPPPAWEQAARRHLLALLRIRPLVKSEARLGFYNVEFSEADRLILATSCPDYESRLVLARSDGGLKIENLAWAITGRGWVYLAMIWPSRMRLFSQALRKLG